MAYFVYITASKRNGTIYTGVTNNLERRITQHKFGGLKGFTEKYDVGLLVRFQEFSDVKEAIMYEKKIKGWTRNKKSLGTRVFGLHFCKEEYSKGGRLKDYSHNSFFQISYNLKN